MSNHQMFFSNRSVLWYTKIEMHHAYGG